MKKNLMSVIILALVVANLVLTALLTFVVWPETQKANKMIEAVCSAIDLELNDGSGSPATVPIDQLEEFKVNGGDTMTMNLANDSSGNTHYAVIGVTILMNTKSDGYKKYGAQGLSDKESIIKNSINHIVRTYTIEDFNSKLDEVQNEILKELQGVFGADFIVGVNFSSMTAE